jgi:hypothetical protein
VGIRRTAVLLCLAALASSCTSEAPSAAAAAALMVRLETDNDDRGVGRRLADYLADGSVVRAGTVGLEANHLTAPGLATLRALLAKDADLLARPLTIKSEPDHDQRDKDFTFVLTRADGSRFSVTVPDKRSPNAAKWAPDPAIARLNDLAGILLDPAAAVGVAGLADPSWTPWRSERMAVFVIFSELDPFIRENGMLPDLSTVGWPFPGNPESIGPLFEGPSGTTQRCAFLPSADVAAAIPRLASASRDDPIEQIVAGSTWQSGGWLWGDKGPNASISVAVMALLPADASASCADVRAH